MKVHHAVRSGKGGPLSPKIVLLVMALQQATPARFQAQAHLRLGNEAFVSGRVAEAITEYETAAQLFPSPGVYYNLGQAYEVGERPKDALAAYESFVAGSTSGTGDITNAPLTEEQRHRLDDARQRITVLRGGLGPSAAAPSPSATSLPASQSQGVVQKPLTLAARDPSSTRPANPRIDVAPAAASVNPSRKTWWLVGIGAVVVAGAVTALIIVRSRHQSCTGSPDLSCVSL
jgi:hypothetical protein